MNKTLLAAALMSISAASFATPIVTFGEDVTTSGVLGANSTAARDDFLSQLSGVGTEDFESFSSGNTGPLSLNFPGTSGSIGATITGSGEVSSDVGFGRFATSGSNYWRTSTGSFKIEFTSGINAFGFNGIDIGDFVNAQMTLNLEGGGSETLTVDHSLNIGNHDQSTLFFGFIDTTTSYTSIEFFNVGGGDTFAFDDMIIGDIGQINSVSEPGTLALLGLGLAGIASARRRK